MTHISILHLTDLHRSHGPDYRGRNRYANRLFATVEQELYEDLRRVYDVSGPWDLVIFSGDLVFSGGGPQKKEFDLFQQTIARLWEELESLGPTPQLLTVPGNHDLSRPDGRRKPVKMLRRWYEDPKVRESFWMDSDAAHLSVVREAFAEYQKWEESHDLRTVEVLRGWLPGDFACRFEKDGTSIGIVGLNSTFLQLSGGDYKGRLALDAMQLVHLLGEDSYARWFGEQDLSLLITHHPPNWLSKNAREEYHSSIAPHGRFTAHLCGHHHRDWREQTRVGGAAAPEVFCGPSWFGLEQFEGPSKRVDRAHGYSILRFEICPNGASLRRWPRLAVRHNLGHWQFVRNARAEVTFEADDGTPATPVALRQKTKRNKLRSADHGSRHPSTQSGPAHDGFERAFDFNIDAVRQITNRLWSRLRGHVVVEDQKFEFLVEADGSVTVTAVLGIRTSQPVPFIPYGAAVEEPASEVCFLEELGFRARPAGRKRRGDEIVVLQTDNLPRRKRCVLFFFPPLDSLRKRSVEVTYRWPGFFAKLIRNGSEDINLNWRTPVRRAEIVVRLAPELSDTECVLVGDVQRWARLSSPSRGVGGGVVWKCRFTDTPAGEYLIALKRSRMTG